MRLSRPFLFSSWLASLGALSLGAATLLLTPMEAAAQVVISQVYGAGGNTGAVYRNDFVELFNRGTSAQSLNGWSIQYASATGTGSFSASVTVLPNVTLNPGQYLLVQESGGATGVLLPTADVTGTISMAATAGKVILANISSGLACNGSTTPCSAGQLASIVDLVGYGTANFYEGAGPAPAPSAVLSDFRAAAGCTDTNNNSTDFSAALPSPRNSLSTLNPCSSPGVNLSINDVALAEGNSGATTFTFTVSLTSPAPVGGVTFDIATTDNTATTADSDYVAKALTGQTIVAGDSTYTFSVTVNGDTTIEANETFFVNITNVTGATVTDGQGLGTINNDDVTLVAVHAIQGSGSTSPLVGTSVSTTGIVTGLKSNGFFMQEPDASVDADPNTSEGVFVFTSSAPPAAAVIGASVQVTATVQEFIPSSDPTSPPTTELISPTVIQLSTGNPLPAPIVITAAETTQASETSNPMDSLEEYEGMRVTVASFTVTGATQGNIAEAGATVSSTGVFIGVVTGVARPFREAGIAASDPLPAGAPATIPRFDENPERIRVDSDAQPGTTAIDVAAGTIITNITGPLDYGFRCYTIDPDAAAPPTVGAQPGSVPAPPATTDELTVASFNMERFFDTINDPSTSDPILTTAAFDRRVAKASLIVRTVQRYPDVIGVEEMENLATLQAVADQINNDAVTIDSLPDPNYAPYLVEGHDIGGIDVGFLVKASRVTVNSVTQIELPGCVHTEATCYTYVDPNTGSPAILNDRPPLLLLASIPRTGGGSPLDFTVIVNHLRSLSSIDDNTVSGLGTAGGRVREKRRQQAEFLANYIQGRQVTNPDEPIITVGDMNAFRVNDGFVDSIGTILGTPAPASQVVLPSADLVNPDQTDLVDTLPASEQYSYNFDGNAQTLDHIIVNPPALAMLSRFAYARNDSDFAVKNYESTNELRISDHDQPVAYFSITSVPGVISPTAAPVAQTTATLGGNAASDGGLSITERGVVYSETATDGDPLIGDPGVVKVTAAGTGTGVFTTAVTGLTPATSYSFKAYATNSTGTGYTTVATFTTCPTIGLNSLNHGTVGVSYAGSVSASGGTGPYAYALTSGTLPTGLSLNTPAGGDLTGTPSVIGTFSFQITATDANGCTGSQAYTVWVGSSVSAGDLVIREFRYRGPAGPNTDTDECIEIANRSSSALTIAATDGSSGFGIAAQNAGACPVGSAQLLASIPNGTVIPVGGFYLAAHDTGYSLNDYGGMGAAVPDATWAANLCDGSGVGVFRSSTTLDSGTALDAVGFATLSTSPYLEGPGLPAAWGAVAASGQYAFTRKSPYRAGGVVQDTGDNSADFHFVSTDAALYSGVQSALGTPGPQTLTSPVSSTLPVALADPGVMVNSVPNRLQSGNYYYFRRMLTNNTGAPITTLKFRIADLSTLFGDGYNPGVQADWRGIGTSDVVITLSDSSMPTAKGLTLEAPTVAFSATGKGAGYNASFTVNLGGPLADGASVYVNIGMRNIKGGGFYFVLVPEVLN